MTDNRSSAGAHSRLRRSLALLVLIPTAIVAVGGGVAFADTVTNNVTVGGNDTTTVGSTTSVAYLLNKEKDGSEKANDCNAMDGPVTVSVSVAVPAGTTATITPSSLSFTDCVTPKSLSLGASKPGEYAVTLSTTAANVTTSGASFTLKVQAGADTTGPVLTLPSDQNVQAASKDGAALSYTATAFDAGDNKSTPVTCAPASGSTFAIGQTTVSCSSQDSKGNTSTGTFKVTVADTVGPVLSLTDTVAEATGADGAKVSFVATALAPSTVPPP